MANSVSTLDFFDPLSLISTADSFQLATISVQNATAGAETGLVYQFQLRRASRVRVEDGDYLDLLVPPDSATTARWNVAGTPTCNISAGGGVKKCEILSSKRAKITLKAQ